MITTNKVLFDRLLIPFVILLAVSIASAQQQKKKRGPVVPEGVEVLRDREYANPGGISLKLDLYRPEQRDGNLPVVVWVHGGGWKNGSKDKCKASWLAAEGFAVASINYRLIDVAQWPAQLDDCRAAVRWLREYAGAHDLDPDHIGAWGSSAGGHLVALMGTRDYPADEKVSSRVQAVCDWFGPSELLTMPPNVVGNGRTEEDVANSNGARLLGVTVKDAPALAKEASALDNVSPDDAPFLIMHGDSDPGVPPEQSIKLDKRLREAGVDSTLVIVKGAGHGGEEFSSDAVRAQVQSFFEKYLGRDRN